MGISKQLSQDLGQKNVYLHKSSLFLGAISKQLNLP